MPRPPKKKQDLAAGYTGGTPTAAYNRRPGDDYTGGTPTAGYQPKDPQVEDLRPEEDFSGQAWLDKNKAAYDGTVGAADAMRQRAAANAPWSASDPQMPVVSGGRAGVGYVGPDVLNRMRLEQAAQLDAKWKAGNQPVSLTNPALLQVVKDAQAQGIDVTAQDVANMTRIDQLDRAANVYNQRIQAGDSKGAANVVLTLQKQNIAMASMLPKYAEDKMNEAAGMVLQGGKWVAQDPNVVQNALTWLGDKALTSDVSPLKWMNTEWETAQHVWTAMTYTNQAEAGWQESPLRPLAVFANWDDTEKGKFDPVRIADLKTRFDPKFVEAAMVMQQAKTDGDPSALVKLMTDTTDPEVSTFIRDNLYSGPQNSAFDARGLMEQVSGSHVDNYGDILTSGAIDAFNYGLSSKTEGLAKQIHQGGYDSPLRANVSTGLNFAGSFVDPIMFAGTGIRAVTAAKYAIEKLAPGAGHQAVEAALASRKIAGVETNRARRYFQGMLDHMDQIDKLEVGSQEYSDAWGGLVRQHKEIPEDVLVEMSKPENVGLANGKRTVDGIEIGGEKKVDGLVDYINNSNDKWLADTGNVAMRAKKIGEDYLINEAMKGGFLDSLDNPDALKIARGNLDQRFIEKAMSKADAYRAANSDANIAGKIKQFNKRDMVIPYTGILGDVRRRAVNSIIASHMPADRTEALINRLVDAHTPEALATAFEDENKWQAMAKEDTQVFGKDALPGRKATAVDQVTKLFSSMPNSLYVDIQNGSNAIDVYKYARQFYTKSTSNYIADKFRRGDVGTRRLIASGLIRSSAAAKGVDLSMDEVKIMIGDLATGSREGEMFAISTPDIPSARLYRETLNAAEYQYGRLTKEEAKLATAQTDLAQAQARFQGAMDSGEAAAASEIDREVRRLAKQVEKSKTKVEGHQKAMDMFKMRLVKALNRENEMQPGEVAQMLPVSRQQEIAASQVESSMPPPAQPLLTTPMAPESIPAPPAVPAPPVAADSKVSTVVEAPPREPITWETRKYGKDGQYEEEMFSLGKAENPGTKGAHVWIVKDEDGSYYTAYLDLPKEQPLGSKAQMSWRSDGQFSGRGAGSANYDIDRANEAALEAAIIKGAQKYDFPLPDILDPTTVAGGRRPTPLERAIHANPTIDDFMIDHPKSDELAEIFDRLDTTWDDDLGEYASNLENSMRAEWADELLSDQPIREAYLESLGYGGEYPPEDLAKMYGQEFDQQAQDRLDGMGLAAHDSNGRAVGTTEEAFAPLKLNGKGKVTDRNADAYWNHGAINRKTLHDMILEHGEEATWNWWNTGSYELRYEADGVDRAFDMFGPSPSLLPDPGKGLPNVRAASRIPGEYIGTEMDIDGLPGKWLKVPWKQTTSQRDDYIKARWQDEAEKAIEYTVQGRDTTTFQSFISNLQRKKIAESDTVADAPLPSEIPLEVAEHSGESLSSMVAKAPLKGKGLAHVNKTIEKYGDEARFGTKGLNKESIYDQVKPGEVVRLDDGRHRYNDVSPSDLYAVDPADPSKGFVWIPADYEKEVEEQLVAFFEQHHIAKNFLDDIDGKYVIGDDPNASFSERELESMAQVNDEYIPLMKIMRNNGFTDEEMLNFRDLVGDAADVAKARATYSLHPQTPGVIRRQNGLDQKIAAATQDWISSGLAEKAMGWSRADLERVAPKSVARTVDDVAPVEAEIGKAVPLEEPAAVAPAPIEKPIVAMPKLPSVTELQGLVANKSMAHMSPVELADGKLEYSPSVDVAGNEHAVHMFQTSDWVVLPHLGEIEAMGKLKSTPFGSWMADNVMRRPTDIWSFATLFGFRFSQRSALEDLLSFMLTGGFGHTGDLIKGRRTSTAIREASPHIETKVKTRFGKEREEVVVKSRLGMVATPARKMGDVLAKSNLDWVQSVLLPSMNRDRLLEAAAAQADGNSIPLRAVITEALTRMRFAPGTKFSPREIRAAQLMGGTTSGQKMLENVSEAATQISSGAMPHLDAVAERLAGNADIEVGKLKKPVYFGDFKKLPLSSAEKADPFAHMWWHRQLQAIVQDDGPIGQIFVKLMHEPERAKAAIADAIRKDTRMGYKERFSLIKSDASIGDFANRYYEASLPYFTTKDGVINERLRRTFVTDVGKDGETNLRVYWRKEGKRGGTIPRVSLNDLQRMNIKDKPAYVLGRESSDIPFPKNDKGLGSYVDRLTSKGWDWMGEQYARIAREPIYLANSMSNFKVLEPLENRFAQGFANARAGVREGEKAAPVTESDRLMAEHIVMKQAQDSAYAFTLNYMDNPGNRSQLAWKVRNLSRYYRATEDFARRAARLAKNYPDAYYKLALTYQILDDTAWTYRDDNGDVYFMYPMNGFLQDAMSALAPWMGMGFAQAGDTFALGGKLKNIAPSTDPKQWLPTFSGPATMPLTTFFHFFPALQGLRSLTLGDYSTAGQTDSLMGELADAVMPAGMKKAWTVMSPAERDSALASSGMGAISSMIADGSMDVVLDPNNPMTLETLKQSDVYGEAQKRAFGLTFTKMLLGYSTPASPQAYQNNVTEFARDLGFQGMSSVFHSLIQENGGDITAAYAEWMKIDPEGALLPFTVSKTKYNPDKLLGLTKALPYKSTIDWMRTSEAKDLASRFPDSYLFLSPHQGNEIDWSAWGILKSMGVKVDKTEDEMIIDLFATQGENLDRQVQAAYAAEQAKYDPNTEEGKKQINALDDQMSADRDAIARQNPYWATKKSDMVQPYTVDRISQQYMETQQMLTYLKEKNGGKLTGSADAIDRAMKIWLNANFTKQGINAYTDAGKIERKQIDASLAETLDAIGASDPAAKTFITSILSSQSLFGRLQ